LDNLVEIQCRLPEISIGNEDTPIWKSNNSKFSYSETWNQLRVMLPEVDWFNIVWFPLAIPRHSFILWLTFRDVLTTKDRMSLWGYTGSIVCLFCHGQIKSKEHIFFSCSFSRRIWRVILANCGVDNPPVFGMMWLTGLKGECIIKAWGRQSITSGGRGMIYFMATLLNQKKL